MKHMNRALLLLCLLVLLSSCKPSNKYVGDWYAVSASGEEFMINFSKDKVLTISNDEEKETHNMSQTVSGIYNKTRYFKINMLGDNYYVIFKDTGDEGNAEFLKQTNEASNFKDVSGDVLFKMNRNDYPSRQ